METIQEIQEVTSKLQIVQELPHTTTASTRYTIQKAVHHHTEVMGCTAFLILLFYMVSVVEQRLAADSLLSVLVVSYYLD